MSGLTLDAGALIGFDRNDRTIVAIIARLGTKNPTRRTGDRHGVTAGVKRQARLAHLLSPDFVAVEQLDNIRARAAGQLCGVARSRDVIDASVVLCARARGHGVLTSDPDDLRRLDASLRYVLI